MCASFNWRSAGCAMVIVIQNVSQFQVLDKLVFVYLSGEFPWKRHEPITSFLLSSSRKVPMSHDVVFSLVLATPATVLMSSCNEGRSAPWGTASLPQNLASVAAEIQEINLWDLRLTDTITKNDFGIVLSMAQGLRERLVGFYGIPRQIHFFTNNLFYFEQFSLAWKDSLNVKKHLHFKTLSPLKQFEIEQIFFTHSLIVKNSSI